MYFKNKYFNQKSELSLVETVSHADFAVFPIVDAAFFMSSFKSPLVIFSCTVLKAFEPNSFVFDPTQNAFSFASDSNYSGVISVIDVLSFKIYFPLTGSGAIGA